MHIVFTIFGILASGKCVFPFPNIGFIVYINQILNTFFQAATGTMDYNEAVRGLASSTLGGILGTYQLGSLLAERSNVQ